jgi:hypothetical protein
MGEAPATLMGELVHGRGTAAMLDRVEAVAGPLACLRP